MDLVLPRGRQQRRLVDEVPQVGPENPGVVAARSPRLTRSRAAPGAYGP